ncbi:MAG: 16S rRNA (adenine1518-N6/adenine1519-N6)-dimethyltransferase [Planctomycetota bacterium]|jgi:16S rRNA (adenine1518-N6/adenine1519-N6)-dimethyltransferase
MSRPLKPGRPAWKDVRAILDAEDFHPSRRLGQNFLLDENMVQRIALDTELEAGDFALEIGTGCGFLTSHIAAIGAEIVSVEIDQRLMRVAELLLAGWENVSLIHQDVLAGKHQLAPEVLERLPKTRAWHAVGNLPYSVASPLMVVLARLAQPPKSMTALVQAEVAERVAAKPGGKQWGPLSARLQIQYKAINLRNVPPQLFWPRPKVESAVLRLTIRPEQPSKERLERFDTLVDCLFQSRRKAALGLLAKAIGSRELANGLLDRLGIEPDIRAGSFQPEQLMEMADSDEWTSACAD